MAKWITKTEQHDLELDEIERGEGDDYRALTVRVRVDIEWDGRNVIASADPCGFTSDGEQVSLTDKEQARAELAAAERAMS